MKRATKLHRNCQVERTKIVKHGTIRLSTGEMNYDREEKVTGPCGTAIFSDREKQSGVCNSCLSGWSDENNTPTTRGLKQIADAKAAPMTASKPGWLPVISFSLGSSKPKPDADPVEESVGLDDEWVTLANRNVHNQPVRLRRRGRPVFGTREEAVKAARNAIKNKLQWVKA